MDFELLFEQEDRVYREPLKTGTRVMAVLPLDKPGDMAKVSKVPSLDDALILVRFIDKNLKARASDPDCKGRYQHEIFEDTYSLRRIE